MRTSVGSWSIKILLTLLVLSFVSFYGWQAGQGCNPSSVATVNGEQITIRDYQNRVRSVLENYRALGFIRGDVSEEMLGSLKDNVLTGMINEKLKVRAAHKMGILASEEKVRDTIQKQFSGSSGQFDFDLYKRILMNRLNTTPGAFEKSYTDSEVAQLFDQTLEKTAWVTDQELKDTYALRNEKVNLEYVELSADHLDKEIGSLPTPTEDELKKYFEGHSANYQMPETRELEIAWVEGADLAKSDDADLTKALTQFFPNDKDPSVTGERVHAAHILLKTTKENEAEQKKKIDALYERLQKGEDFGKMARTTSEDSTRSSDGDLGFFGKGAMVKEFEAAAFSLRPGNISKPIKSQFGFHIIKVLDQIPAGPRTVERLKAELKYRWTHDRLETPEGSQAITKEAQELLKSLKDKAAKTKSLAEVKSDPRIRTLKTPPLSSSDPIAALPDGAQLVRAAQALAEGTISDPVAGFLSKNQYLVRVAKIYPPASPQYANVRTKVSEEVMKERKQEALSNYSKKLLKEWKDAKKPFSAVAKAQKYEVRETGAFARSPLGRIPGVGVSPSAMANAFSATTESPILADPVVSGNKIYLLSLKEHMAPDWTLFNKDREQLRKVAEDELGNQRVQVFTQFLRTKSKITKYAVMPQSDAM